MKKIYLILTFTRTALSRIIKHYTKDEYSHISISLDKDLKQMYSFGRLYAYNPFYAGFVHEEINSGTYKRFKNTTTSVYEYDVTDQQYEEVKNFIEKLKFSDRFYYYNIERLIAAAFNKKIKKNNSYYCSEFVKDVLETAHITSELPEITKPMDFINLDVHLTYKGLLQNYPKVIN